MSAAAGATLVADANWSAAVFFALGCVSTLIATRFVFATPSASSTPAASHEPVRKSANKQSHASGHEEDDENDDDDDGDDSDDDDAAIAAAAASGKASLLPTENKMVLVVRNDLGMGKGKIGAQCGHATLGAYKRAVKRTPSAVASWSRWGQAKICVKVNSEAELLEIQQLADAIGVSSYVVQDAGRTQIEAGSLTVLAVGPAPVDQVNQITGHLKLL
jgi:PTH2 family peptidyl-tRNA hydrolase